MTRVLHVRFAVLLAAFALLAACTGPLASPVIDEPPDPTGSRSSPTLPATAEGSRTIEPSEPLVVVTSTTVLADFVRQIGDERVSVQSLMPAGRDPHTFEPSPSDASLLSSADLLVINGLGLDEWLEDLAGEVAADVPLVVLAEELDGVEYLESSDDHHAGEGDEHDEGDEHEDEETDDDHEHGYNPHLWLDVANARRYVERITATLIANDEAGRQAYEANAAAYDAELAELDDWIRQQTGALPEQNRRVVSFHDAFPYFAQAYGIEIAGVVVESPGQEPSAAEIAAMIAAIREASVRAVLSEIQFSDRLAQVVSEETGVRIVHELYTDSLGNPPLDTYDAAMRWNTERIVEGLR